MIAAVLAGLVAALGWGSADFIARFTSQGLGLVRALFGMLLVSTLLMVLLSVALDLPLAFTGPGLWLVLVYGMGLALATGLLYAALSRGPVAVAAPLVGSFPAFNVLFAMLLGVFPAPAEWLAMGLVMLGVLVVARASGGAAGAAETSPQGLRLTVVMSLLSALLFAVTIAALQEAALRYGELQTVAAGRAVALLCCLAVLLWRRGPGGLLLPLRWWPMVLAQGVLDGGAYLAIVAGSQGAVSVITPVIASAFSAVTVLLARLVLREPMRGVQWLGVVSIVCGVAGLSAVAGPS